MKKLIDLKQLTNTKYLNFFDAEYLGDEKNSYHYYFASRRKVEDLSVNNTSKIYADAVRILPYYKKDNQIYVVLIKEFRHPLNRYIYSTPAGCIDEGEEPIKSAIRELKEETGATVKSIVQVSPPAYSSAGLTDETIVVFEAEVELGGMQELGETEEIFVESVLLKDIPSFIQSHEFGYQSQMHLLMFYYKNLKE